MSLIKKLDLQSILFDYVSFVFVLFQIFGCDICRWRYSHFPNRTIVPCFILERANVYVNSATAVKYIVSTLKRFIVWIVCHLPQKA